MSFHQSWVSPKAILVDWGWRRSPGEVGASLVLWVFLLIKLALGSELRLECGESHREVLIKYLTISYMYRVNRRNFTLPPPPHFISLSSPRPFFLRTPNEFSYGCLCEHKCEACLVIVCFFSWTWTTHQPLVTVTTPPSLSTCELQSDDFDNSIIITITYVTASLLVNYGMVPGFLRIQLKTLDFNFWDGPFLLSCWSLKKKHHFLLSRSTPS